MRFITCAVTFSLLLAGCAQISKISKRKKASLNHAVVTETEGITSAAISSSATIPQTISVSGVSSIAGSAVTFQPGSLAVDTTISLQEGQSLALASTLSSLGQSSNEVLSSAPAVVVLGGNEDALRPFTLRLSIPTSAGLSLGDDTTLAVLFRVERKQEQRLIVGLISAADIKISGNYVEIDTRYFGSYQVVRLKTAVAASVEVASTEPIATKAGTVVSTTPPSAKTTGETPPNDTVPGGTVTTVDSTAPSAVTFTGPNAAVNTTTLDFAWTAADDASGIAGYDMKIGTSADGADIFDGKLATTAKTITGTIGQTYYARVRANDNAGNASAWVSTTVTIDTTPPSAGGGLNLGLLPATTATLTWTAGTDNHTSAAELRYQVYYSTSNNIATLSNIDANGTAIGPLVTGTSTVTVSGLTPQTNYWFNLVVSDAAGNRAAYTAQSGTTAMQGPVCFDGSGFALASDGTTIYVGGSMTTMGPCTGSGAVINTSTAGLSHNLKVFGEIKAVASDGAGGWYLGGSFTSVLGHTCANFAHILPDGSFDQDFAPAFNDEVLALALSGTTLYVGGVFTYVDGSTMRYKGAAFNTADGSVLAWNPNANDRICALTVSGSTVFAGGVFTTIGGQSRNHLAGLDAGTGNATSLSLNFNGAVRSMVANGSTLYVGGDFTNISSIARGYIAAITTTSTGSVDANFSVAANGSVEALALNGTTLYAGGYYTTLGGASRNYLGAIDVSSTATLVTGFTPEPDARVYSLAVSGSTLYVGGLFENIAGQPRRHIAALSASGTATSWNPGVSNKTDASAAAVYALTVSGTKIFLGGNFVAAPVQERKGLLALDRSGNGLSWNPGIDGFVSSLVLDNNVLWVGGSFTTAGGQPRGSLAAVDALTGQATGFHVDVTGSVATMLLNGTTLYLGGTFTAVGGQTRGNLASLDTATQAVATFNPGADNNVLALQLSGSVLYAGGDFSAIGGESIPHLVALDATTGVVDNSWNPNLDGGVSALALNGTTLYVGGYYSTIGGLSRPAFAAIDATTAAPTGWDPGCDGQVMTIATHGGAVYAGGVFGNLGGTAVSSLGAVQSSNGSYISGSTPSAFDGYPYALIMAGNSLIVSGEMYSVGGIKHSVMVIDTATGHVEW